MRHILLTGIVMLSGIAIAEGGEVQFVEDFALARDRATALKQLIPGTEDYYYWSSIHLLNTQQYDKVDELLKLWVARRGETSGVWEIRTRQAILSYDRNPDKSIEYLRHRFGINFLHRKEELNADPDLPTSLDAETIGREQFKQRALQIHGNSLNGFEERSLEWLIEDQLNPDQRRELLSRLARPDYPNLVKLIVADLNHPKSKGFGSHGIHRQLLATQLEELLKSKPDLLNQQAFVRTYLTKLRPNPDVDWQHDLAAKQQYLERLQSFADRLAPVHNSLKAHVLYQRLLFDRAQGIYDKDRFLTYIKLPRPMSYISRSLRESEAIQRYACDLNTNYDGTTLLPPVGNDEALVRSYLAHFLVDAADTKEYEPFINDVYLRHLFAETKIVNGLGDPEQWASLLPPEPFRDLKNRVDIDFDYANETMYASEAPVSLVLHVKNVSTLIVKVFEINTENFYRQHSKEVDTDINLDGLVANSEQTYEYDESPLRRVERRFDFPMLKNAGVYVIDFIGNGQSSRALIRKGRLRHLVKTTPAGQAFTILNEDNRQVKDARIWISGHEYQPQEDGTITVPFSTKPGRQAIVMTAPVPGNTGATYSSLGFFNHEPESYRFRAGFYVDRESLLTGKTASVAIRPGLSVNGTPVSLKLLEEVKLSITSTDLDGTSSSVDVAEFKLLEDREATYEFQVPPRLASLQFRLSAKIKKFITGDKVTVTDDASFSLNAINRTENIEDLHLLCVSGTYLLEMRGRTGEPRTSRRVVLTIKHRDFRNTFKVVLKTDANGRVDLGKLEDIQSFTAQGPGGISHAWNLIGDRHTYNKTVHGRVGEPIVLPYFGTAREASRGELSLLEYNGGTFGTDRFEHLSVKDGLVHIARLPAGDYNLLLKSTNNSIVLRITEGEQLGAFAVGSLRQLELSALKPLQVESIKTDDKNLTVQLRNASKFARVHIYGLRYYPEYDAYNRLSRVRGVEPYRFSYRPASSVYLTGRNIGDEYRYIIDRKYATKYPGNMLERPSLLLNPWAVRDTETGKQEAAAGTQYGSRGQRSDSEAKREEPAAAAAKAASENFTDLNFLASTSGVLLNLIPDENGVIKVPRDALGNHQQIQVLATDPFNTTCRTVTLPEPEFAVLDLRLSKNLDPEQHYTQQKQISIVPGGQSFTLHDIATAKFESYDSLSRVYTLYATLSTDPKLAEFSFIVNWPELDFEKKRELYSKYASHELSFFLFKKDPDFYREVIRPYLANKKDKTFMDHFLLEDDLSSYLLPWNYGQLNTVERILLARRIEGERQKTSRHVDDLLTLLPPDIDRFNFLFDTAVQRSALEADDALGLKAAVKEVTRLRRRAESESLSVHAFLDAPAPAAPTTGGAVADKKAALGDLQLQMDRAKRGFAARGGRAAVRKYAAPAEGEESELGEILEEEAFYDDGVVELRQQQRQLFRKLEKTQEWAENNYYHLTIDKQDSSLVTVNKFWNDFAGHDPASPFLSRNIAESSRNFPEMLLALAVLDLPFKAPEHKTDFDEGTMTLVPGGPLLVFHEEIQPATKPESGGSLLVSQNFYKHGDRHRRVDGEQVDKFITDEFLIHTVYGCHVVITNPTSTRQKLNVLTQIPRGAIAVLGSKPTNTLHLDLEPYHTQTLEYHFYFPAAGRFPHFPVHVAKNEQLLATADPMPLNVVDRPTKIDTDSWDYISQYGSLDDVVRFLDTHNVDELNLDRIAWRMQDEGAFRRILPLLANRHVYNHTLWSYAFKHKAVAAAREYLQHADNIVKECGGPLRSTILTIDPVKRRSYEHLEYKPLVNARAHTLGKRRQIVNDRLNWQYHRFLKVLAYHNTLDDDQLLTVTYYLLLQDRVEEALETFARVSRDSVATKMQYDYCAAYLKFFGDAPEEARAIADKYVDHPVDRWRKTFAVISAQLDEATGKTVDVIDAEDRNQQQSKLAATEPDFDFKVESRQINVNFQNLKTVKVNFYGIDVELLFSRNPFVQQFGDNFASIKPNLSLDVTLPEDKPTMVIDLPEQFRNSNVLVEIVGAGETKTQPYFSNSLSVQVIENYGQVRVTHRDTHKPVSKAYVKVYAQTPQGEARFYKDGYTDLRGRFDYASLSTDELDVAQKFSVLVLSEEFGAVVREATPPKQ